MTEKYNYLTADENEVIKLNKIIDDLKEDIKSIIQYESRYSVPHIRIIQKLKVLLDKSKPKVRK